MYVALHEVVLHGCMVYTECTKMAAVSHGTSHVKTKQHCSTPLLVDIQKHAVRSYSIVTHLESHASAVSLLESGE